MYSNIHNEFVESSLECKYCLNSTYFHIPFFSGWREFFLFLRFECSVTSLLLRVIQTHWSTTYVGLNTAKADTKRNRELFLTSKAWRRSDEFPLSIQSSIDSSQPTLLNLPNRLPRLTGCERLAFIYELLWIDTSNSNVFIHGRYSRSSYPQNTKEISRQLSNLSCHGGKRKPIAIYPILHSTTDTKNPFRFASSKIRGTIINTVKNFLDVTISLILRSISSFIFVHRVKELMSIFL